MNMMIKLSQNMKIDLYILRLSLYSSNNPNLNNIKHTQANNIF